MRVCVSIHPAGMLEPSQAQLLPLWHHTIHSLVPSCWWCAAVLNQLSCSLHPPHPLRTKPWMFSCLEPALQGRDEQSSGDSRTRAVVSLPFGTDHAFSRGMVRRGVLLGEGAWGLQTAVCLSEQLSNTPLVPCVGEELQSQISHLLLSHLLLEGDCFQVLWKRESSK